MLRAYVPKFWRIKMKKETEKKNPNPPTEEPSSLLGIPGPAES